jgi:hypothetical protein
VGRRRLILAATLVVAGAVLWIILWRPLAVTGGPPDDGFTRVSGVIHVHTTLSDGGGTPDETIRAARRSGLDFLVLTDHNVLDAKALEGYHDGVLTLVGAEISTTAGHLLGLGIPDPVFRFSGDPEDALDDVHALGGAAYAAHPLNPRSDFLWTGWGLAGPWGLELVNGDSQWRQAGWWTLLRTAALYQLNPRYALLASLNSPAATLARWDALLAERDVVGIAGADAHSRVPLGKRRSVRFPSYESLFDVVRTHVLLERPLSGDAASDGRAVLSALAHGRAYVGLDALAPADGFSFTAVAADARRFTMGDTVAPEPRLELRVAGPMPEGARIVLLRDGRAVATATGTLVASEPQSGVYRVEVRVPGREIPWVLSNPIYVFAAGEAARRKERGAWPTEVRAPAAAALLDAFAGSSGFGAEFDSASSMNREVVVPRAGPGGKGAARMEFRLGVPGPGHPFVSCALVERRTRDLSGRKGLVFWLKGDRSYRLWVQVRDENPASLDGGTEWWFASVRTSPEWHRVAIPFERLRSVNPRTDGRLDLDKVRELVFVLDQGAVKPETAGTIWIADLGVY